MRGLAGRRAADSDALAHPAPPQTLVPGISWVLSRLDELRDAAGDDEVDRVQLIPTRAPSVLSILGDMGTGKSTTLKYVCDRIAEDPKRIVTPAVSPERFAEGDTLFGWVLAALTEMIPRCFPDLSDSMAVGRSGTSILEQVDLLRRQEALTRSAYRHAPTAIAASPDEWAEGTAAVTTAGLHLAKGWVSLLEGVSSEISQLVVPVDDADQVPGCLNGVLRDIRWLTIHPSVAVLVCANEEMLLRVLAGDPELGFLDATALQRHAAGVLTKALPMHLRHSVPPLSPRDRLRFSPPGEEKTLLEVLRGFRLADPPPTGPLSLGDLFELRLGERAGTSPYAEILPETPRKLDQLWRELHGIATDETFEEGAKISEASRRILERALELASVHVSELPRNTMRIFDAEPHGPSVEFDFSQIRTGSTIGTGPVVLRGDGQRISIRRIDAYPLRWQRDPSEKLESVILPAAFTNAHYFALDLSIPVDLDEPPLFLWGIQRKFSLPGGSNWQGSVEVEFQRESTDHCFAPVPAWESFHDYYLYMAAWNWMVNLIRKLDCTPDPRLLEWSLLRHALFVVEIQAQRAIDQTLIDSAEGQLRDLGGAWSKADDFERLSEHLERLYTRESGWSIRQGDFNLWVDAFLPWSADSVLGVPELGAQLLDLRKKVIEEKGDLARANNSCAQIMRTRISRNLSAEWISHPIELLNHFDENLSTAMAQLHEVAKEEQNENEGFAMALEQRGVPRETVGQLFLAGLTPDVTQELLVAGVPSAAIETLAQRFPPVEETERGLHRPDRAATKRER
jgi:hypothetical protein